MVAEARYTAFTHGYDVNFLFYGRTAWCQDDHASTTLNCIDLLLARTGREVNVSLFISTEHQVLVTSSAISLSQKFAVMKSQVKAPRRALRRPSERN
jgi:hypothetical protein